MIWRPSITFENIKKFEVGNIYGGTEKYLFQYNVDSLWNTTINLWYTEVFMLIFTCKFDFTMFPFDNHNCYITFGDINHKTPKKVKLYQTVVIYDTEKTTHGGSVQTVVEFYSVSSEI